MKAISITLACLLGAFVLSVLIVVGFIVGTLNRETAFRKSVEAQLSVRDASFDKMWKIIQQKSQVTKASAETRKELVKTLVDGRGDSFVKIIHESNPESAFSSSDFAALSNAIESERLSFFREEKFLISKYQEYSTFYDKVFQNFILDFAGRKKLDRPNQILSERTKQASESGEDDQTELDI